MHENALTRVSWDKSSKGEVLHVAGFSKPPRRSRGKRACMGARISQTNVSAMVSLFSECVCPRPSRGDLHKMEIFFYLFFFGLYRYSNMKLTAMRLVTKFQLTVGLTAG